MELYLDCSRDKKDLLLETQLTAILSGIVGVEYRTDVLGLALGISGLQVNPERINNA